MLIVFSFFAFFVVCIFGVHFVVSSLSVFELRKWYLVVEHPS